MNGRNDVDGDDMKPGMPEPEQKQMEETQKEAAEEREAEGGYQ